MVVTCDEGHATEKQRLYIDGTETDTADTTNTTKDTTDVTNIANTTKYICDTTKYICDDAFVLKILNEEQSEDLNEAYQYFRDHFDNFVFEGGGIRGICFGGAIKYLEDHDLTHQLIRIAGSSAGAIVAAGLAVGYKGDEIIKLLHETNFEKFKDDSFGVIMDVWRFINEFGIYKGEAFLDWIGNVIKAKTGNADITLKNDHDRFGKKVVVIGRIVNK